MLKIIGAACLICLLCSCAKLVPPDSGEPAASTAPLAVDQYVSEIKKLEEAALKEKGKTGRAETYYRLAKLYASCRNPEKSYSTAYGYLLKSAESDPSITANAEFENMLAMLADIQSLNEDIGIHRQRVDRQALRIEKLEKEMDACRKDTKRLTDENIRLIKENVALKLSIEQLKALDIEIERKRKNLR
jgi:hypothetical protein